MGCIYYSFVFPKLQLLFRLFLLEQLIPEDGRFELGLSLALDKILNQLEGAP